MERDGRRHVSRRVHAELHDVDNKCFGDECGVQSWFGCGDRQRFESILQSDSHGTGDVRYELRAMKLQAPITILQGSPKPQASKSRLLFGDWNFSGAWGLVLGVFLLNFSATGAVLEFSIRHTFAGEPLQLGSLRYDNSTKENFSVT